MTSYAQATRLQATDLVYGLMDTGAKDPSGNPIYSTRYFPGALFIGGGGASLSPGALLINPLASQTANFGESVLYDPNDFAVDTSLIFHAVPSLADGLIAQGSQQSDALQLSAMVNIVTSVSINTGVRMWAAKKGQVIGVWNLGTHPMNLYPLAGGTIGAASANFPVQVYPGNPIRVRVRSDAAGATLLLAA